jgi:gamma-glutamylcyclotransferase (GGCT)/AIG2-like uncharacterized protein YtfP
MKNYVFVYGTLKQGFRNHHLLEHCVLVGKGRTKNKYALYVDGIPYVTNKESVSNIQGEVYLVDEDTLTTLDQLERHPEWYHREKIDSVIEPDGKILSAWIYFNDNPIGDLIKSGVYT